jgi:hypothetical protein
VPQPLCQQICRLSYRLLSKHGSRFGAVGYDDLQIRCEASRFIEDGSPPADVQVVDYTWKHPNKSGGPDHRFRDNRQLPVCLYDVMHLSSNSGVNELMEFSRTGFVQPFSTALHDLPRKREVAGIALLGNSVTSDRSDGAFSGSPAQQSFDWKLMAGAAALIAAGVGVAAYTLHDGSRASIGIHGSVAELSAVPTANAIQSRAPAQVPPNTSTKPATPNVPTVTVKTTANLRSGQHIYGNYPDRRHWREIHCVWTSKRLGARPSVYLAHGDLTGSQQCPEQHGGSLG